MPRKSSIDAPGALHHVIGRGINRQEIFSDETDYRNFLDRLGDIEKAEGQTLTIYKRVNEVRSTLSSSFNRHVDKAM